jgi:hypothetical protein
MSIQINLIYKFLVVVLEFSMDAVRNGMQGLMVGVNVMVVFILVENAMPFRKLFEMGACLDLIGSKELIILTWFIQECNVLKK